MPHNDMPRRAARILFILALLAGLTACVHGRLSPPVVARSIVASDGAPLDVRVMGRGGPLLLLTGYAMTSEMWDPDLIRELSATRRLVLMDNRGLGPSSPGGRLDVSMRRMALDAAEVLEALGIERADVLGWSMGGMIAQELALARPDAVRALVLVSSASEVGPLRPGLERLEAMSGAEIRRAMFPPDWLAAHPEAATRVAPRPRPPDALAIEGQRAALAEWPGTTDRLGGLGVPVLLLAGGKDWVVPPEASRVMYERLSARTDAPVALTIIGQGSHWMMHQFPDMLAHMALGFLSARFPSGAAD